MPEILREAPTTLQDQHEPLHQGQIPHILLMMPSRFVLTPDIQSSSIWTCDLGALKPSSPRIGGLKDPSMSTSSPQVEPTRIQFPSRAPTRPQMNMEAHRGPTTVDNSFIRGPFQLPCQGSKYPKTRYLPTQHHTLRLQCSSCSVMTSFWLSDHNRLPKKELHSSLWVSTIAEVDTLDTSYLGTLGPYGYLAAGQGMALARLRPSPRVLGRRCAAARSWVDPGGCKAVLLK